MSETYVPILLNIKSITFYLTFPGVFTRKDKTFNNVVLKVLKQR